MYRLLIVENDNGIAEAIKTGAEMRDIETHITENFREIMSEFAEFEPHIVLLDISLPFFNGYHWCSEIRKVSKVPIIFISSASDMIPMAYWHSKGLPRGGKVTQPNPYKRCKNTVRKILT